MHAVNYAGYNHNLCFITKLSDKIDSGANGMNKLRRHKNGQKFMWQFMHN